MKLTKFMDGALLATLVASPSIAMAQEPDIIVVAQKREQAALDIGVDLSAIGGDALDIAGRPDAQSLSRQVPGMRVQSYSPTITIFNIRGVSQNDYSDAQEAPIAFYEDEVYSSAPGAIAGRTFDLEQVEVLRGPQGTLFGRNATGGLVHYITAKPTDRREGYLSLTAGSYNQISAEGAISGPLTDRIRARLALISDQHKGYVKNRAGPDVGNSHFYAGRLQVETDIGDSGTLALKLQTLRNHEERSAGYAHRAAVPDALGLGRYVGDDELAIFRDPLGNPYTTCPGCDGLGYKEPDDDPYTAGFNDPVRFDRTVDEAVLRYDQDLDFGDLTAIASAQRMKKDYAEDSDMSPATFLTSGAKQHLEKFTGELRLAGQSGGVDWIVGAYGIHIRSDNDYFVDAANSAGLVELYGGRLTTDSAAAFAQIEAPLAPKWRAIAGLRYTHDWKHYDFTQLEYDFTKAPVQITEWPFNPRTDSSLAKRSDGGVSAKLQLNYRPHKDMLIYAGVDRGTKSGGFNAPAIPVPDPALLTFKPETLTSYSAGAKAAFAGGKAQLALSAFHYDYDNYQAFENADGYTLSVRNKDVKINGAELDASLAAAKGLTLGGSLAWLDSKIKDVILPFGAVRDREMPNTPEFSATARAAYRWALLGGEASLATHWRYEGSQYLTPYNAEVDRTSQRFIGDLRVAWRAAEQPLEIALSVENVTDKAYRIFDIDFSQNFGFVQSAYARPRWIGLTLTVGNGQ